MVLVNAEPQLNFLIAVIAAGIIMIIQDCLRSPKKVLANTLLWALEDG